MRTPQIHGKILQLAGLSLGQWPAFAAGWWTRKKSGNVPCAFPASRRMLSVPLREFYDGYMFLAETTQGRRELTFFLSKLRTGDIVYDVGAFRGAYGAAVKAAFEDGIPIFLFEPLSRNANGIREVCRLNQFQGFNVVEQAVGSGSPIRGAVDGDCMLRQKATNEEEVTEEFASTTIDHYMAATGMTPTVIKIDVEGFEAEVIEGARQCLSRHKPRLWLEVHPGFLRAKEKSWKDMLKSLTSLGYQITYFDDYNLPEREIAFHVWCES